MKKFLMSSILVASALSAAQASAVCSDFAGSWTGTCKLIANGNETEFPWSASVSYSPDCSEITLQGFNIPSPGVVDLAINTGKATEEYIIPGVVNNHGNTANSVQLDTVNDTILVNTSVDLLGSSDTFGLYIYTLQKSPLRLSITDNGKLKSVVRTKYYTRTNGGDELVNTTVRRCRFDRD